MNTFTNISSILFLLFIIQFNSFCVAKKSECNHLQPYVFNKLSLGVDITKLNLFPDRVDFFSRNGFKDLIFNHTCLNNRPFVLPNYVIKHETISYYLPDHMEMEYVNHSVFQDHNVISKRSFEGNEDDYRQNMMKRLQILDSSLEDEERNFLKDLNYDVTKIDRLMIGAFKLNRNYQSIKKERYSNRRIPIESRINLSGYRINIDDKKIDLTNAFQNEIRNLPLHYEDGRHKYESLISTFGTHYFTSYEVGGLARANFKVIEEEEIVQIDQLSEDEFKNNQPFSFNVDRLEFDVEENFGTNETIFMSDNKPHKRTISFYGGRIEKRNHNVNRWKNTTINDPWIIGGKLAPLSRLMKDKTMQRSFLRAMMSYLDKAEILNLKETVSILEDYEDKDENSWYVPYKNKVEELNVRQFINHTALVQLSDQFNDEINFVLSKRKYFDNPSPNRLYNVTRSNRTLEKNKITNSANSIMISCWLLILIFVSNFLNLVQFKIL